MRIDVLCRPGCKILLTFELDLKQGLVRLPKSEPFGEWWAGDSHSDTAEFPLDDLGEGSVILHCKSHGGKVITGQELKNAIRNLRSDRSAIRMTMFAEDLPMPETL